MTRVKHEGWNSTGEHPKQYILFGTVLGILTMFPEYTKLNVLFVKWGIDWHPHSFHKKHQVKKKERQKKEKEMAAEITKVICVEKYSLYNSELQEHHMGSFCLSGVPSRK